MSENLEFFRQRWEAELPAFGKVIRALPADRLDYRPHERSTSAGDLAWQMAREQAALCDLLDRGQIDWSSEPAPADLGAIADRWEKATGDLRERLAKVDDAAWKAGGKFFFGGELAWESTVDDLFWGFLFDMVHHRGQLSTYIRPMGGKVPAIYGPSGDDSGA